MGIVDDWAERHILQAQQAGQFTALPGLWQAAAAG